MTVLFGSDTHPALHDLLGIVSDVFQADALAFLLESSVDAARSSVILSRAHVFRDDAGEMASATVWRTIWLRIADTRPELFDVDLETIGLHAPGEAFALLYAHARGELATYKPSGPERAHYKAGRSWLEGVGLDMPETLVVPGDCAALGAASGLLAAAGFSLCGEQALDGMNAVFADALELERSVHGASAAADIVLHEQIHGALARLMRGHGLPASALGVIYEEGTVSLLEILASLAASGRPQTRKALQEMLVGHPYADEVEFIVGLLPARINGAALAEAALAHYADATRLL